MYITSLEVTRDNQNRAINFTLEAQEIRTAGTFFIATKTAKNASAATDGQTDGETDKGAQEGEEVEESLSTNLGQMFGWIPE
jgi:ribosomal protein L12E/L44/L45/RPP1/RPP2